MRHVHVPGLSSSATGSAQRARLCLVLGNWYELVDNTTCSCPHGCAERCRQCQQIALEIFGVDSGTVHAGPSPVLESSQLGAGKNWFHLNSDDVVALLAPVGPVLRHQRRRIHPRLFYQGILEPVISEVGMFGDDELEAWNQFLRVVQ